MRGGPFILNTFKDKDRTQNSFFCGNIKMLNSNPFRSLRDFVEPFQSFYTILLIFCLAHSWSVKLRTGCHFEKENESVYAAVISASRVEFTQQNKVVFWIFIRNVLKHGFTENCSYLEVSEGGYEMTDGRECRDVNNALVDLGSGTVLLWIEFDDGEGAENFCSEILM